MFWWNVKMGNSWGLTSSLKLTIFHSMCFLSSYLTPSFSVSFWFSHLLFLSLSLSPSLFLKLHLSFFFAFSFSLPLSWSFSIPESFFWSITPNSSLYYTLTHSFFFTLSPSLCLSYAPMRLHLINYVLTFKGAKTFPEIFITREIFLRDWEIDPDLPFSRFPSLLCLIVMSFSFNVFIQVLEEGSSERGLHP